MPLRAISPGTGIGDVSDLFREVGGMLLAAQERAREGAVEKRPGELVTFGSVFCLLGRWRAFFHH
jgi:hypothetical protein